MVKILYVTSIAFSGSDSRMFVVVPDRQADRRTLRFAGDIDKLGRLLPMSAEVLQARTENWYCRSEPPKYGSEASPVRASQMRLNIK